ncbi:MAG: amino acid adenylation domain-containing protein, partial [Rhodococcus sp. (in: high G+C Gram-positive bacteria)]
MVAGGSLDRALTIDDVPRLVATAARVQADTPVLTIGDATATFAQLHDALDRLDTAMGGILGPESLLPLALADLGVLDTGEGAVDRAVASILTDAAVILGIDRTDTEPAASEKVEPTSPSTLVAAFEASVDSRPDAVALVFGNRTLTYAELDRRSNRVARRLLSLGVAPDRTVGLALRRSFDLVVGMYGIVKAGGAYMPLDPDHPYDRLEHVLRTAQPVLVLADESTSSVLPTVAPILDIREIDDLGKMDQVDGGRLADSERLSPLRPDNLAYVVFTSGSTGRPKGVAVSHSAIVANVAWRQRQYVLTEDDVVLQKTPFTFDVSVWEFFWPLQVGARLVIAEPDGHLDPAYMATLIASAGVTVVHFVPSMLAVFVDAPESRSLPSLRYVFASGEELGGATAARFAAVSAAQLHNLYGPTEAAVDVTHHRVTDEDVEYVPIGTPVDDTDIRVLDSGLEPVPPGVVGELYLTGIQLARGYLSRPTTTADRFVADPYDRGTRMYRTGDLVKQSDKGVLTYLGRSDFQVKLRGLRIELGEIEAVLAEHDAISQAVVVVRDDRLLAYVVESREHALDLDEVWTRLRRALPAYMVPGAVVVLAAMPLGSSGKLDRRALPTPASSSASFVAPGTATEVAVSEEYSAVLGVDRVGRDDDFFALGGNSLAATRLVARLNERHGVRIAVRDFFDAPTVAAWATLIDAAEPDSSSARPALASKEPWPEPIPLSYAQQRMWFLNRLDPGSSVDNIALAIRLTGPLDVAALRAAVVDLGTRHASLRTRYPENDGKGSQSVASTNDIDIDWRAHTLADFDVADHVQDAIRAPFDVAAAPPFRVRLLSTSEQDHVLVVVVHHIAADGYSMVPLARDVMTAYSARAAGDSPGWTPLTVQYPDYALWQRE